MAVIHISEAEAVRDLPALLAQVRAGAEILIESDEAPMAIRMARQVKPRRASEILADLERDNCTALLPEGFAEATEEGIRAFQQERLGDRWEFF